MASESRQITRYEQIPTIVRDAVLAAEENFFSHSGVELLRVCSPAVQNQPSLLSRPWITGPTQDSVPKSGHRHQLPAGYRVVKDSVLGGLHHEYRLVKEAALRTSFPFADDSYELRANYLSSRSSNLSVSAVTVTST